MTRLVLLADALPQVVLCCTDCERLWEPTWTELSAGSECPWCGCWSWIGRLAEPEPKTVNGDA